MFGVNFFLISQKHFIETLHHTLGLFAFSVSLCLTATQEPMICFAYFLGLTVDVTDRSKPGINLAKQFWGF